MRTDGNQLDAILTSWRFDEADNVRRVRVEDDREVIQVRLPLGIEQYEIQGRPDGHRPYDKESWYHVYQELAEQSPSEFCMDDERFERLKDECLLYYYRYLLFFQMQEYEFCARDTLRNLEVLDFVGQHCTEEQITTLEQYRPYMLRMHVMARALDRLQDGGGVGEALQLVDKGRRAIENLPELDVSRIFTVERRNSLRVLTDFHRQLSELGPLSPRQRLEQQLTQAVDAEEYEEAAKLRDQIASLPEDAEDC